MLGFVIKNDKYEANAKDTDNSPEGDEGHNYSDLERTSIILDFLVLLCCQDFAV